MKVFYCISHYITHHDKGSYMMKYYLFFVKICIYFDPVYTNSPKS